MGHNEGVFVVTEGKNTDRWYYDRLLSEDPTLADHGILTFTVASISRDIDGGGEGKSAVLRIFRKLRATRQLRQHNSSGLKTMIFCVDADHDRFTSRMLRSDHLVYTRLPDVEAHVIDSCNLIEVVSHVASLPEREARLVIDAIGDWQAAYATGRLEWMILCCTAEVLGLRGTPRPGTPPTRCDSTRFAAAKKEVVTALRATIDEKCRAEGLDVAATKRHESLIRRRFEAALRAGEPARTLKGRWVLRFLKLAIEDEAGKVTGEVVVASEQAILSAARASARFDSQWCSQARAKVHRTLTA